MHRAYVVACVLPLEVSCMLLPTCLPPYLPVLSTTTVKFLFTLFDTGLYLQRRYVWLSAFVPIFELRGQLAQVTHCSLQVHSTEEMFFWVIYLFNCSVARI